MNLDDDPPANSPEDIGYRAPPPAVMPIPQRRTTTMATKTEETTSKDEGPRSFAVLLQQIGDGDLHDELGAEMQAAVGAVTEFTNRYQREGKATITLVLNVKALGNGSITVAGDVKSKLPKSPRAGSLFWPTKGNNLSLENPRQQKLPLREVPASTTRTKDLSTTEAPPARGV